MKLWDCTNGWHDLLDELCVLFCKLCKVSKVRKVKITNMAHSSRKDQQQQQIIPENFYDNLLVNQNASTYIVHKILEQIINEGAQILHTKYLQSQIKPYASRTLARELVMNASWALEPIGPNDITAQPDEDLEIPPIDEWAGGVLPVRSADATGLRSAVPPPRETKVQTSNSTRPHPQVVAEKKQMPPPESKSTTSQTTHRSAKGAPQKEAPRKKPKPQVSEAVAITRAFEEAKKKTAVSMKAVTVDSDFSVIQITEPKGLPPALIVPKVTTKRAQHVEQPQTAGRQQARAVIRKPQPQQKRRVVPKLVEPDTPIFDEEIAEVSYSDKFICAPGVTFKDGTVVKSRAQQANPNQMTRAQYEAYLEEMKRGDSN